MLVRGSGRREWSFRPAAARSRARQAQRLQLPLVEVVSERGAPAGTFALRCAPWPSRVAARALDPDVAFLAMTSGTTGVPKVIELTEENPTRRRRGIRGDGRTWGR